MPKCKLHTLNICNNGVSVIFSNAAKNVWDFLIYRKLQFCILSRFFLMLLSLISDKEMEKKMPRLVKAAACMECHCFVTELPSIAPVTRRATDKNQTKKP